MNHLGLLVAFAVVLMGASSAPGDLAEEVQIRFQIFALVGRVSGDTDLEEDIWARNREDWRRIDDVVTLFDRGYFRLGDTKLELKDDEGLFWGREKLSFLESQKVDLPADRIRRINAPGVLLEKEKSYTIKIHSQQSFQYFEKRADGLFELRQIDDLPTGLDIRIKPRDKDGRILFEDMRITVRAVGRRQVVDGVELPVGRPIVEEQGYDLALRVRPNNTYGILVELKEGQGAVVVFFTTAVVTRPVLDTIKRELGDAPYSIQRKTRDGRPAYEVDAWIQGRHIELNVYADGGLRDRSDELGLADLPAPVREAIQRCLQGRRLEDIHRVVSPQGAVFVAEVDGRDRDIDYIFAEDGTLLRTQED
jgi:hypothetical protein